MKKTDLAGGMVIDGLPSGGWVGIISSTCLISSMGLKLVGTLESESFPSLAIVHNSEPWSPARIHADEERKLSLIVAEFPVTQVLERPLAMAMAIAIGMLELLFSKMK